MNINLRDYQIEAMNKIFKGWEEYQSILFQMPTGTGKTTLFCSIAKRFIEEIDRGKKVLIVTHRRELVIQVFERLFDFHLKSEIISSNLIGFPTADIHIASIQTLIKRPKHHSNSYSLIVIDEAHHTLATTYKMLWSLYPSSKYLGVTATPIRTNGEGFTDLFETLIVSNSVKWFIQNKYLCDIKYFASNSPDLSNIKIKAGDYDETELSEIMQDNSIMADLIESYKMHASKKKIIVFAVNRLHSQKIAEKYISNGISARYIDTETSNEERIDTINDFIKGSFKVLCNVNIFTEGFDCPDVDGVQLARPTKSLTLFLQQVGRCMRPFPNKEFGIILDNAGLWKEHGLPKMDRDWSLLGLTSEYDSIKNRIQGLNQTGSDFNNHPQESKYIRLFEIGEIENDPNLLNINEVKEILKTNKVEIMNDKINKIKNSIDKLENSKNSLSDDMIDAIEAINEAINKKTVELNKLIAEGQSERFEILLNELKKSCYQLIENNDFLFDEEKEEFKRVFNEPYIQNTGIIINTNFPVSNNTIYLYKVIKEKILNIDKNIRVENRKGFDKYLLNNDTVANIKVQQKSISCIFGDLYFKPTIKQTIENQIDIEDVSNIGTFTVGKYRMNISSENQLDFFMEILRQNYNRFRR